MTTQPIDRLYRDLIPEAERMLHPLTGEEVIASTDAPRAEYRWLNETAVVVVSERMGRITARGADAPDYLHRRLSQDIRGLASGHGAQALQLDADGRMEADLLVYREGEDCIRMLTEERLLAPLRELVEKFIFMEEITVESAGDSEEIITLCGPKLATVLRRLSAGEDVAAAGPWDFIPSATLDLIPCSIHFDGRWGVPLAHISADASEAPALARALLDECREAGGGAAGRIAFEFFRTERGVTRYGVETGPRTIPLDACLHSAVHTEKGCYSGQEIIARIVNLGHPARRLALLEAEGEIDIPPETPVIMDDKKTGRTASASVSLPNSGRTLVPAYLKWNYRDRDRGTLDIEGTPVPVRVRPLPGPRGA